jgi:hypothetical protein
MVFSSEKGGWVIERCHPKGVKPKMKERELRGGANWQGALR